MTDLKLKKLIIPIDIMDEDSVIGLENTPYDLITWVCTNEKGKEKRHSVKVILN